jgi:diguanylate cyclase (GGDEF)-like protein
MKILIAEDHALTARLLADLVQPWGYDPIVVGDGIAALEVLRHPDAPRLAVVDWVMPRMDGATVCREIRQDRNHPYTYLILLTGRGGRDPMLTGLDAGADEFLVKPVDVEELKARLNAGRRILLLQEELLEAQRQLRERATHDTLTGLWNRGAILDILERELARSVREGAPVGIILADLDHFKKINDTYGHLAGDTVLGEVARSMLAVLRPYDNVGRYGGEEFLVVLPGCGTRTAATLAERLRRQVAADPIEIRSKLIAVTVSLGVIAVTVKVEPANPRSILSPTMTAPELLRVADAALYRAKSAGRNRAKVGRIRKAAPSPDGQAAAHPAAKRFPSDHSQAPPAT